MHRKKRRKIYKVNSLTIKLFSSVNHDKLYVFNQFMDNPLMGVIPGLRDVRNEFIFQLLW